jgi:hypothetical protein
MAVNLNICKNSSMLNLGIPPIANRFKIKVSIMAISGIQAASAPPPVKPISTNEIQKAAAAKVNAQVKPPESTEAPAKQAAPAAKSEQVNNQPAPKPPTPSVNTSGQVTGTLINTTA